MRRGEREHHLRQEVEAVSLQFDKLVQLHERHTIGQLQLHVPGAHVVAEGQQTQAEQIRVDVEQAFERQQ